jgi:fructose-1,6-bisphosphatase/inositol monophosphatase family enzyme
MVSGSSSRMFGSDLLACVYVASGRLEAASIKDRNYHDIASGIFLVRESGGDIGALDSGYSLSNGVLRK